MTFCRYAGGVYMFEGTRARALALFLATLGGIAMGVWGDFWRGDIAVSPGEILAAIVLSPLVVTFGGDAVAGTGRSDIFFFGGLLFWLGYALLVRLWLKRGNPWWLILVVLWCSQGFFLVVHRLHRMSSV
ncbi:hypothetical protein F0U62_01755 [Cystobacter fuscus]|uniref:hypothetical protein n=1 Tax=Cystobacter fuscus TaxID=43 RepID=UPI002B2D0D5E|nr:hypothetical protein F0U62_01755 [Cystobacter fuscus]